MTKSRAAKSNRRTRIQRENEARILKAALETFSAHGFRGATLDQIAVAAGMSKPNVLYYFHNKEDMHRTLLDELLDTWLDPLRDVDPDGDPLAEILQYVRRKLDMSREHPHESRLFANEILQGAPGIEGTLKGPLKALVDDKAALIQSWIDAGKLADCNPYHLIFSIWATTQHYADFDAQIAAVLGNKRKKDSFDEAARFLTHLYESSLKPVEK
jgi:TetR/AcrR family transcriptional regulator